jgi:hypothetical protein
MRAPSWRSLVASWHDACSKRGAAAGEHLSSHTADVSGDITNASITTNTRARILLQYTAQTLRPD